MEVKFLAIGAVNQDGKKARQLIENSCLPFGSLERPTALAVAMLTIAEGDLGAIAALEKSLAHEGFPSTYEVVLKSGNKPEVTVVTSTSSTRITLRVDKKNPEHFEVQIKFPGGSVSRGSQLEELWAYVTDNFWLLTRKGDEEPEMLHYGRQDTDRQWGCPNFNK